MTRCMGALFTISMAGDLNWNGLPREGVANRDSESQKLIHLAGNQRFPKASKFEMEKDSKDFLRHALTRVKQAVARAEKEEAAMAANAAGVEAGARHPLDHSYGNVENPLRSGCSEDTSSVTRARERSAGDPSG
ncbi:hypothetical protein DAPPUDRAFT_244265 [Daphnia pulex]|uniref:Uncharacterized protein n=1 Tax=Daphnia pulex TaxID=6669 RepID=E9GKK2_DAPPU|nr:hypothetical protein DAPPUDRAFT_244265 [Daphnia pulex]|eukprot:EFX80050.1 hypothetical protein DAPPUDRAFT_244265 [Daphnia pulex]